MSLLVLNIHFPASKHVSPYETNYDIRFMKDVMDVCEGRTYTNKNFQKTKLYNEQKVTSSKRH